MPVAVRASSGHSKDARIPMEPTRILKKFDLRTAVGLQGAYHVTSPQRLGINLERWVSSRWIRRETNDELFWSVSPMGLEK